MTEALIIFCTYHCTSGYNEGGNWPDGEGYGYTGRGKPGTESTDNISLILLQGVRRNCTDFLIEVGLSFDIAVFQLITSYNI